MSEHDPIVCMRQMLDAAEDAVAFAGEMTWEELGKNRLVELAVLRLLEVLGEAANRVPAEVREGFADIPWRRTIDLRNRLIHGYDSVNLLVVAQVVTEHLPPRRTGAARRDVSENPGSQPSARSAGAQPC
jgi:uncharacterized protein with HEPN domain